MLNESFLAQLSVGPAYCFTSDFDWAPESMIEDMLSLFASRGVPLTPFITNPSPAIERRYAGAAAIDVGVHPNFRPGSTHGSTEEEVVDHVLELWPAAQTFRSHSFVDSSSIASRLFSRGLRYDSNLCLHLQPRLVPLRHSSGLIRFPVFLEDDVLMTHGFGWDLDKLLDVLRSPGLKIFNFHPRHVCVNAPTLDYYTTIKPQRSEWRRHVHAGRGAGSLLLALLDFVRAQPGIGIFGLRELYERSVPRAAGPSHESPAAVQRYDKAGRDQRAAIVREAFDGLDSEHIYATSRDFNLREIEIDCIIGALQSTLDLSQRPRILDVGCGNGYTDVRIAQEIDADIVGLDFSEQMIRGARQLTERFGPRLRRRPAFERGDARCLQWPNATFDAVISERCVVNLPDRETQDAVIESIRRVLKDGGVYVAVEGTRDGLVRLNDLRARVGLEAIPDRAEDNAPSLKFDEAEIERVFARHFTIERRQYFGMYYLISRVVHPLVVAPQPPRFDSPINVIARRIASQVPDVQRLGHVMAFVLRANRTDGPTTAPISDPMSPR